ncbi:MAG: hypothetical protein LBC64_09645 [Fibromonadaceae bacterium]|nr:hypothetical protein [Fibromonadaceae bacterium]
MTNSITTNPANKAAIVDEWWSNLDGSPITYSAFTEGETYRKNISIESTDPMYIIKPGDTAITMNGETPDGIEYDPATKLFHITKSIAAIGARTYSIGINPLGISGGDVAGHEQAQSHRLYVFEFNKQSMSFTSDSFNPIPLTSFAPNGWNANLALSDTTGSAYNNGFMADFYLDPDNDWIYFMWLYAPAGRGWDITTTSTTFAVQFVVERCSLRGLCTTRTLNVNREFIYAVQPASRSMPNLIKQVRLIPSSASLTPCVLHMMSDSNMMILSPPSWGNNVSIPIANFITVNTASGLYNLASSQLSTFYNHRENLSVGHRHLVGTNIGSNQMTFCLTNTGRSTSTMSGLQTIGGTAAASTYSNAQIAVSWGIVNGVKNTQNMIVHVGKLFDDVNRSTQYSWSWANVQAQPGINARRDTSSNPGEMLQGGLIKQNGLLRCASAFGGTTNSNIAGLALRDDSYWYFFKSMFLPSNQSLVSPRTSCIFDVDDNVFTTIRAGVSGTGQYYVDTYRFTAPETDPNSIVRVGSSTININRSAAHALLQKVITV